MKDTEPRKRKDGNRSVRPCQCLFCVGLAFSVVVSHDPPHAFEPVPGEHAVWFGRVAVVQGSTSRGAVPAGLRGVIRGPTAVLRGDLTVRPSDHPTGR